MTRGRLITPVLAFILGSGMVAAANADPASMKDWQMSRLFEPTQADLRSEHKGRVMIYDGMKDTDVERALDEEFHRLEHVMFTRTVVTDDAGNPRHTDSGEVVTESDDGCD